MVPAETWKVYFIEDLIVTDEAAFHMNGLINRQNNRKYSPKGQPPQNFYEKSISREQISVWMGLTGSDLVIGPLFYEGNMTGGEKYFAMLNEQIIPQLRIGYGERFERLWFMQDMGPHVTELSMLRFFWRIHSAIELFELATACSSHLVAQTWQAVISSCGDIWKD